MLETLRNAWKIEDLRKKLIYTFFILMLTRIGSQIPVPFLDPAALTSMVSNTGGIFSYLDMLTGGAFSRSTLFAPVSYTHLRKEAADNASAQESKIPQSPQRQNDR